MTFHVFDPDSVTNPAAGPAARTARAPLWAGTEPMDYPDPLCACGGPWVDDRCLLENTLDGQRFALSQALRALGRACIAALRLDRLLGWLESRLMQRARRPDG